MGSRCDVTTLTVNKQTCLGEYFDIISDHMQCVEVRKLFFYLPKVHVRKSDRTFLNPKVGSVFLHSIYENFTANGICNLLKSVFHFPFFTVHSKVMIHSIVCCYYRTTKGKTQIGEQGKSEGGCYSM